MKKNIGQLASEVYVILEGQENADNIKILTSVITLLGIDSPLSLNVKTGETLGSLGNPKGSDSHLKNNNAKSYFEQKTPNSKGEELAVAAKFRVDNDLGDAHTKEDFKAIIKTQAKRRFDEKNFGRDIGNAIRQAKFFISGDQKGEYILSAVGEKYVEALPDRTAANGTRKSSKGARKNVKKKGAKK